MGRTSRVFASLRLSVLLAALALATLAPLAPGAAWAAIVINEIYPDPVGTDDPLERVEIYNNGLVAVDVTGWCIHDAASIDGSPALRCRLPEDFDTSVCPASAVIQPGEFRVVKAQVVAAWLNQGGDVIYLCSNRTIPATVVHQVTYPSATGHTDEVWSCVPNGTENFAWRALSLCGSNAPAGDITAPATVANLAAVPGGYPGEIRLTWTAPGDDGATGTASLYEIKVSHAPITSLNFGAAADLERWINEPLPAAGGAPETLYVAGLATDSTWYFALTASDEVPNVSGVSNSPGTAPAPGALLDPDLGLTPYFGNLHSHTSYSDGVSTPTAAYAFARNTAPTPLDFLCVTDHNHVSAGMSYPNYAAGQSQAAAANDDGNFVAIWGQEWGLAANGHVNIFEAPGLFGWDGGNFDYFVAEGDYAALYTSVLAHPPTNYPVVLEWCHPASGDFDNLQVTNDAKAAVHLMAVVNGPSQSTSTTESDIGNTGFDGVFQEALRKGFRVSPSADQDNHNATWGAATQSRTAVLTNAKTKGAILTAMAARRTYATQDHNVVVQFSADGHAMGDAWSTPSGVHLAVEVTDPDLGDSVAEIDLYRGITGVSNAVLVAGNVGSSRFQWREHATFAPLTEAHYYLKIRMADNQDIWTGPVYVTYDPNSTVAVDPKATPATLSLSARPNPFQGRVSASFALPRASRATLGVYDPSGRLVRTLLDQPLEAGEHRAMWDGRGADGAAAQPGIFFLRLQTDLGAVTHRILLLR